MNSPYSGRQALIKVESKELVFRNETYSYMAQYYEDPVTHDRFTTTEQDESNINQVYNQYRMKHSIPSVDEIKALRHRYALSTSQMSVILGFDMNLYKQYEDGYVPSETHGRILKVCLHPGQFKRLVIRSRSLLDSRTYQRIMDTIASGTNRM